MTLMGKLMTGAGVLALSTGVAAAAPAVVANDLHLRAGPGVEYPVVAAMPGGATVDVMGCEGSWCRVAYNGAEGWASRAYMGLGGGVAAAPAYGESYAAGGYAPRYGYDEDSHAYGSSGPGYTYGYSGDAALRGSYGYSEGGRTFGNERRFSEQSQVRGERRIGENTTIRSRSRERGVRAQGLNDDSNARTGAPQRASEIQGANPMLNAKDQPAAGASGNARAQAGGNARATTGAGSSDQDHGANFIGPGKKNVDNH